VIPWLWAYFPVRNVALEGQHWGVVTTAFGKEAPAFATRVCSLSILNADAGSWSSVSTKRMFGLCAAAFVSSWAVALVDDDRHDNSAARKRASRTGLRERSTAR